MDRTRSGIRLLALFSAFFIYKAIMGVIEDNTNEVILWSLITLIYIVSLITLHFIIARWEREPTI